MEIRFKFRSSMTFDSVNVGNQSFISIGDLKSEIVKMKHLNLSHDFDLIFSDSLTGQEYKDETIRIPSGSSVIIKRVPATSTPFLRGSDGCSYSRDVSHAKIIESPAVNLDASGLHDFGGDLCSIPDEDLPERGKLESKNIEKRDLTAPRCSVGLHVSCDELETKGFSANEGSTLVIQSQLKSEEHKELERTLPTNHFPMERSDMPSELKCSLCKNFFKEAVMIPCCQHSFCEKCIHIALAENGKCPMCFSTKCKAADLLPNVSLRQAIKRFLESRPLLSGPENDLHRYAPDGESGIQVRELSYAATVTKKDLQLNCSTPKRRSSHLLQNKFHDHTDIMLMKTREDSTEFEGENDPQNVVRTGAQDSCTKKDRFCVAAQGGEINFATRSRIQSGRRTCYRCGSPDHLIRDCPISASFQANFQNGEASVAGSNPGCVPIYWPGSPTNVGPFVNMYGGPRIMMYNTTMPPITPFVYHACAPSMCGGYPFPSGHMRMGVGNMASAIDNYGSQPCNGEVRLVLGQEQRNVNMNSEREWTGQLAHSFNAQHDSRGIHHSDDSLFRRSEGKLRSRNDSVEDTYFDSPRQERISYQKVGRDSKISQSDKSISERDLHDCRNLRAEDRHEKHYRYSRTNVEKKEQYIIDSKKESTRRRTEDGDRRMYKEFEHHSSSNKEHSYSSDSSRRRQEESSHRYRNPNKSSKSEHEEYIYHQEKTTKYSDDDHRGHYHDHKRKRLHKD